jgi:NTP pyrophosphatase (non-canonical NTP hydrolase)
MSDFKDIYEMQKAFQLRLGHDFSKMTTEEKEHYTRDMILYLLEEAHELLRETNFKTYKKVRKPISIDNIQEELSDIGHFFLNLLICWDVTPEKFADAFEKKHKKNIERFENPQY